MINLWIHPHNTILLINPISIIKITIITLTQHIVIINTIADAISILSLTLEPLIHLAAILIIP